MIGTDLRVREVETKATVTADAQTTQLPERFVQARDLYIAGFDRLEYRNPTEFWSIYAALPAGTPQYFTVIGEDFYWAPVPTSAQSVIVNYYARPAPLAADADTTPVLQRWPGIYLYAALSHAQPYIEDDGRVPTFSALYDYQIKQANDSNLMDRASGDVVPMQRRAQLT